MPESVKEMDSKDYLEKFKIEEAIRKAVAKVLKERPPDAIEAIGKECASHAPAFKLAYCPNVSSV